MGLYIQEREFVCQREGLHIFVTEYKPEGEHLPIAIVSHGFMSHRGVVCDYAKALAKMGYVSYSFDFCGGSQGKSEGQTTQMSIYSQIKDLKAVIEFAKEREYSYEQDIVLMGCSLGGLVSALTANEVEVSKLILVYPAFCAPDDIRQGKVMHASFDVEHIPDIIHLPSVDLGRCFIDAMIDMDPYQCIQNHHQDVLIIHGTNDSIVDITYSEKLYETYLKNGNHVLLKIIEEGEHGFSKEHQKETIEYMRLFLRE